VDRDGHVVPYGQPADRLLMTNLYNLDQPLIRYDLADAVTISDTPCPCGCAHRRIMDVGGRMDGALTWPGAISVSRRDIETIIFNSPGVVDFFVGQTDHGVDLSVTTDGSSPTEPLRRDLADLLIKAGMAAPDVLIHEVGTLDRLWSGKVRQFAPVT
jgi:phenylacetate-CoA ligase